MAGSGPTSLDGGATRDNLTSARPWQDRVHARDRRARGRIISALTDAETDPLYTAGCKIHGCCRTPLVLVATTGEVRLSLCKCKHRMCPTCSRDRSKRAASKLAEQVRSMRAPRFVTLTLASSDEHLAVQVERLLDSFRRLRRTKGWRSRVAGGVATIECTWSAGNERWHPHLHVVVDGEYYPHPQLKAAWLATTGDSYIVDIRKVHDATQAARYVASYMTKHGEIARWPGSRIREYAVAMRGRRMVQTFGDLHGRELDSAREETQPAELEPVATVREINDLAEDGCTAALDAQTYAHRLGYPWTLIWPKHATPARPARDPDDAEVLAMIATAALEVRARAQPPPPPAPKPPPPETGELYPRPPRGNAQRGC